MKKYKILLGVALFICIAINVSVNFDIEKNLTTSLNYFVTQAYADSESGPRWYTRQECGRCDLGPGNEKGAEYFCFTSLGYGEDEDCFDQDCGGGYCYKLKVLIYGREL